MHAKESEVSVAVEHSKESSSLSAYFFLCRPEYCVLPVQAIRCELAGIEPVGESSVLAHLKGLFSILCGHVHVFRCGHVHVFRCAFLCTLHCKSR